MQPPIPAGTVLQSRYRVIKLLGQGGFGRTYLVEDLGRFNEHCALKEFVPQQGADHFSTKASELFQREAAILYQIQHPQIPNFRATFEQDQRLFLIQDYVDGVTYRELLNQRQSQGMAFSESEVRQFLQQMLPVLAHIHAKGIIHRDISPDNIMQRRQDHLPVLIDFGVVKEVVTRLQMPETATQATTVGKLGYAPSEQMQSGRAYPSSDLYSLAVSAVVLLTGREPQELFDDINLSWRWQQYVTVSPGLAQVLDRAMSYRPGDRYQSVSEMAQALGSAGNFTGAAPSPLGRPNPSQMQTVAVGRKYTPTQATTPARPNPAQRTAPSTVQADDQPSFWEDPLAVTLIGVALAVLAGIGGWLVVNLLNRQPNQQVDQPPTPSISLGDLQTQSPSPTATPTQTPTPQKPVEYSQQLGIQSGGEKSVSGTLRSNETISYELQGVQGQPLKARLQGEGVLMTVLGPDGKAVDSTAQRVLGWQGDLPYSGQYLLKLSPVQGLESSDYTLEVSLGDVPEAIETPPPVQTPTANPTPTPTPEETNEPQIQEQRLRIPQGQTSVQATDSVGPDRIRRYLINAQQGQVMTIQLPNVSGPVALDVRFPGGELIDDAANVLSWQGQLPLGGDYIIDVSSPENANYTLKVTIQ